jgi:hypothetical protein
MPVLNRAMHPTQWASFYHLIGTNDALYDPSAVGRTLGYNGLVIALFGSGVSPVLLALAQAPSDPTVQRLHFQAVRIALLCVQLPATVALPIYLRRVQQDPSAGTPVVRDA